MAQDQNIPPAERVVLALAALLVAAGIAGFYYFGTQPQVVRVLMVLGGVALGALLAGRTATGRRTLAFFGESRAEVRRVIWPARREALQITGVVAVAVAVGAVVLWIFDWAVARVIRFLIGIEG